MALDRARFARELRVLNRLGLDSVILIYHLEDMAPYAELTEELLTAIASGGIDAVLSTITVTELLVRPFSRGQAAQIATFEQFLQNLPNTTVIPVSYKVAREAARLRGQYGLRTPDALVVATALAEGAGGLVTNDAQLRRVQPEGLIVLVLDDFV